MPTDDILETADKLWRGELTTGSHHPVSQGAAGPAEVADGVAFVRGFANVSAIRTGDGLVLVDTGSQLMAKQQFDLVRTWAPERLHTAVYSHGHIDHVFGVPVYEEESRTNGWEMPTVVAHEAMPHRFDRYILTNGYNAIINQRQFQAPGLGWPTEYRYPDHTYADHHHMSIGGVLIELHHAKGETDDHTWTWLPEPKVLCCGDMFIWASPNAGNPQKVQRFPKEWAVALREMAALGPEVMLPGHGLPVVGADRVQQALLDTAELLESLVEQSLALMNAGARLDDLIHTVVPPAHLMERPYLQPVYDEPEFVVRNIWRLYGGWYDGNPAHLKPAPEASLAAEVAALAGGADRLAARALEVAEPGDDAALRLAGELVELASLAAPDDASVHAARAEVFERRVAVERSTMSKGLFAWAASTSREKQQQQQQRD